MSDFFEQAKARLQELRDAVLVYEPPVPRAPVTPSLPRRITTYSQAQAIYNQIPHSLREEYDFVLNFWAAADCYILLVKTPHFRRDTYSRFSHRWVSLELTDEELVEQFSEMASDVRSLELQAS